MEEKEKRPENEASLQETEAKEEPESPSSPKEKESHSIVTGETTTWNFSQELEAHLQGEIEKSFTFDSATEEKSEENSTGEESKQEEPAVETASAEEEGKTEETGETSQEQEEPVAAEEENKESKDLQAEEKTEPAVAENEEEKEEAAKQEEKIEEEKKEMAAEQEKETNEPVQEAPMEQKDETKAEEKSEDLEKTAVINIKDLREEQPAEQKQPSSQEEIQKQQLSASVRKKIIAVVAALFLVAAGWIGIAFATGKDGQSVGHIFGVASNQLIFQYEQKTFTFDLESAGFDGKDPKTVNKQKLDAWIEEIRKQVERPARDANQERLGDPITPEKVGIKVDLNKLNQMLANFTALVNKPQKLPVIEIQPKVTKADLEKVDQYLIGSYTTSLGNSSPNRLNNIRLASKAINGLILMPGEKFSFNKVVGKRTPERGYKEAGVIVNGEFSEGIGGGICQVSSTLFNSVDEAGLKILQRVSHSAQVTYVPPKRDATVSWGGPDFKFKNNLDNPIVIKIFIKNGRITVNVYTVPGTEVNQRHVPKASGV